MCNINNDIIINIIIGHKLCCTTQLFMILVSSTLAEHDMFIMSQEK